MKRDNLEYIIHRDRRRHDIRHLGWPALPELNILEMRKKKECADASREATILDVRFTAESRHVQCTGSCPLSANSGYFTKSVCTFGYVGAIF